MLQNSPRGRGCLLQATTCAQWPPRVPASWEAGLTVQAKVTQNSSPREMDQGPAALFQAQEARSWARSHATVHPGPKRVRASPTLAFYSPHSQEPLCTDLHLPSTNSH